jgi:hypothetical protein
MRDGTLGSRTAAALARMVFITVCVLIERTRAMSRMPLLLENRHDELTDEGLAGAISVVSDELTATIRAPVLLFSVSGCAILFNVQ